MGDINWEGATLNPINYSAPVQEAAQAGQAVMNTNQQGQVLSAFHGLDYNDPDSVNGALSNLVKAGAVNQAKAVQELDFQRFQQQGQEGGAADLATSLAPPAAPASAAAPASPTPQAPEPLPPAQQAHQQAVIGFAQDAVENLAGIKDPAERAQAAQEVRQKALDMGVPAQFVDGALGDLSDGHLQQMDAYYAKLGDHPEYGGQGPGGPIELHPATTAALNHPDSLTNPAVMAAVGRIASHGGDVSGINAALTQAMGYQGPVAPGQRIIQNGEQTVAPTYGQVSPPVGQRVFNADTGATIVGSDANPANAQVEQVAPANTPVVLHPSTGATNLIPNGAVQPGGGGGPASPSHPAYQPTVAAAPVLAAVQAHPGQYLSGLLGAPVNITSEQRSPTHNAAVGGSPSSEHIPGNGYAVDFQVPQGMSHDQVAQKILSAGVPFDQLIFEPNGSGHIGWGNGTQRGQVLDRSPAGQGSAPASGAPDDGMMHGKFVSAPFHVAGTPAGAMYTRAPDGSISPVGGTVLGVGDIASQQASAAGNPQIQGAQRAITSYNAMKSNIATMSGPAAVSMLAAMTGNTNAAPADIVKSVGLPQEWLGKFQGFGGSGVLTPAMRQQIADAGYAAVQSTYGQASQFNAQRAGDERQGNLTPGSLQAPIPAAPHQYFITTPPASTHVVGKTIETPKGVFSWSGTGWRPATPQS